MRKASSPSQAGTLSQVTRVTVPHKTRNHCCVQVFVLQATHVHKQTAMHGEMKSNLKKYFAKRQKNSLNSAKC